jgi:hypothetical protein
MPAINLLSVEFHKTGRATVRDCSPSIIRKTLKGFVGYSANKEKLEEAVMISFGSYQRDAGAKMFDDGDGFEHHIIYVGY